MLTSFQHSRVRPFDVFALFDRMGPLERIVGAVAFVLFILSGTTLLYRYSAQVLVALPRSGGTYAEGIVGSPRFINPILADSDADLDLSRLMYAGLLTHTTDGSLVPELAESYTISEDGTVYTFTLREGLTFHDGTPLTSEDVVFTIASIQNPALKSPHFINWEGVILSAPSAREIVITLPEPYAPFLENATVGIVPKALWGQLTADQFTYSDLNVRPVGSGPFTVHELTQDKSGIPLNYELRAFKAYALGKPLIESYTFHLFRNYDELVQAFEKGLIDGWYAERTQEFAYLDKAQAAGAQVRNIPYVRTFAVFFNQNRAPVFLHAEVRRALSSIAPRDAIVRDVLQGNGTPLFGSTLPALMGTTTEGSIASGDATSLEEQLQSAREVLEKAGWEREEETGVYVLESDEGEERLAFSIATANTPELQAAAELVAFTWRTLGAEVTVKSFEPVDLTQNVIRPRRYDALFFGEVIGRELDLYAFWHSSQRNDPGLNVAGYADIEADELLVRIRSTQDKAVRQEQLAAFEAKVQEATPAVFLYAPALVYVHRDTLSADLPPYATDPFDRFASVQTWHTETDYVWPFIRNLLD